MSDKQATHGGALTDIQEVGSPPMRRVIVAS